MQLINLDRLWYGRHPLRWVLWPFAVGYQFIASIRRFLLQRFFQKKSAVPIIVVGNLSVGGVGKTPLVIALAKQCQARGIQVGIVSRGYGATITAFPYEIQPNDLAKQVGDEPLLLAQKTGCPVVIAPDRMQAVEYLQSKYQCQMIISDDGLQHYKMGRAIEIVVIDGIRQLGNGLCLPAGPLRERASRLKQVDFIVVNGESWPNAYPMHLHAGEITKLIDGKTQAIAALPSSIAAIAAIGHPHRFFKTLRELGLTFAEYRFPDHHAFCAEELNVVENAVIMTEKDAVKCYEFATDTMYFLPVQAEVDPQFWNALWSHPALQV